MPASPSAARPARRVALTLALLAVAVPVLAGTTGKLTPVDGTSASAAGAWAVDATRLRAATVAGDGDGDGDGDGAYAFYADPAPRWNPCVAITYQVNAAAAEPGALADVREALRRVTSASGLTFRFAGQTATMPGGRGRAGTYAEGIDLVIAWARPGQSAHIPPGARHLAGMGGGTWTSAATETGGNAAVLVSGFAVLNAAMPLGPGFGAGPRHGLQGTRGQLLMHEIGHAVGLTHPPRAGGDEIMAPTMSRKPARWGAGDRAGLALLGTAEGCLTSDDPLS